MRRQAPGGFSLREGVIFVRKYFQVAVAFLASLPVLAVAAVPTEASDAVDDLITDAGAFIGSLWPLLIAVVVALIFMKLFKKGTSKAT